MSGAPSGNLEREVKLGAFPDFAMPDLAEVVPGLVVEERPTLDLEATYLDTPDLQLVRNGVSLRRRTGEGATRWTLKLPAPGDGRSLSRREHEVEDDGHTVPRGLADLVTGWVRRAPLEPVAVIASHRRRLRLLDEDGGELAEVDDDEVTVLEHGEAAARFREVEVELGPQGSSELLDRVTGALEAAGAGAPDPTSKIARALGPRALVAPDLRAPDLDETSTVADVVTAALRRSVTAIVDHDHVVRLDEDPEGVHRVRVATRRLRSDLRTLRPVLDEGWGEPIRAELAELANLLGRVRDADVLDRRLSGAVAALPELDRAAGAACIDRLRIERAEGSEALRRAMADERYPALLDDLVAAALEPGLAAGVGDRPATEVLPTLVRRRWDRLRSAVADLDDEPSDESLHAVRILAKRARYASELAAPVVGSDAAALGSALAHLQDVLGDLHDAVVAQARLRALADALDPGARFAAGELAGLEQADAARLRATWPEAWAACDRKKATRWLR